MNLREFGEYSRIYMAKATRGRTYRLAREWMEAGVPAESAAAWASENYHPWEALPRIAAGLTPEQASEIDAAKLGGGAPEDQVKRWIDLFNEDPRLVTPPTQDES